MVALQSELIKRFDMAGENETPELRAFNRYVQLLEEADRVKDDLKVLDVEMKETGVQNAASIKRLAGLFVKGRIGKEVAKFRALEQAARKCEQLKLFED